MSDTKDLTVPFEKFEPERLTFTDLEENDRSKGQLISYPRYNHPVKGENQPLMLQASWSKLFTYGVPRAGEYYKTDYDRSFLKLPIDSDNQQQMELVSKLEAIDELYGSEKKKKQMFGKKYKKSFIYGTGNAGRKIAKIISNTRFKISKKLSYLNK